jgi:peroxiredoxin Q/BCP
MHGLRSSLLSSVLLTIATSLGAQQPSATPAAPTTPLPAVGEMAPDFAINGSTRYGLLRQTLRLSDLKGQTVVLAFFVRARTRG